MPSITTLVDDIHKLAAGGHPPPATSTDVSVSYAKWFDTEPWSRKDKHISFSEIGDPCLRRLWYKVNSPEHGEDISSSLRIKFLYGDMLENLVLSLAKAAGHEVCDEQKRVTFSVGNGWTISGKLDAVIDGVVVDVKSTTKFGVQKFENGLRDDPFGYAQQLTGYATALSNPTAGFLTIQKELGHIAYFPQEVRMGHFHNNAKVATEAVELPENNLPIIPPVPQSKTSKNMKLAPSCSYCAYKKQCFPKLRTFIYSDGPVYLVDVVDTPRVLEVT
jgi:hypothetical protein